MIQNGHFGLQGERASRIGGRFTLGNFSSSWTENSR